MINDSRNQIERYEYLQRKLLSETSLFQDDHASILIACQQRNAEQARTEVKRHIQIAGKMLQDLVSRQIS